MAGDGRHDRPDGHAAGRRQDEEPDRQAANSTTRLLKRQVAIIDSMTPQERRNPDILKASRKKRIAAGSGTTPEAINKLLKMHRGMSDMMKAMGSGKRGPLAGMAQAMGMGGGHAVAGTDGRAGEENAGRQASGRNAGRRWASTDHAETAAEFPRSARFAGASESFLDCRVLPGLGKRNEIGRSIKRLSQKGK